MLNRLSSSRRKSIAWPLFIAFYFQLIMPAYAAIFENRPLVLIAAGSSNYHRYNAIGKSQLDMKEPKPGERPYPVEGGKVFLRADKTDIGGPSSPEASSFKAAGSNNLVNLFTGDFSYSIPLLDIGGYPVNLFYTGGITMEQEASWVGLGWNINPGTVSRNMRGVPDDFNGEDKLIQHQNVKPNRTWGGELGVDAEVIGLKVPKLNLSLGMSYNNYLGPAIDIGATLSISLSAIEGVKFEKNVPADLGLSIGGKLSSRSGLTITPSLNASTKLCDNKVNVGMGLSTSYNSRSGISSLNLHAETSLNDQTNKKDKDGNNRVINSGGLSLGSTNISFAKPSYMPILRMPMANSYYSGQLELGGAIFGFKGGVSGVGYYSESRVPDESKTITKPLVGFIYSEKANNNRNAVMDLNRYNDAEVTPNTPIISAPVYTYDIFSINGEGTGGMIRAYRGDMGFMRDNVTNSSDDNFSLGFDIAPPAHYGGNWNSVSAPTRVGGWEDGNNKLHQTIAFRPRENNTMLENVYFRNPGESSVTNPETLDRIGRDNLVRFRLSGSNVTPLLESELQQYDKHTLSSKGTLPLISNVSLQNRVKRSQVTSMLTAADAAKVGLEKQIRNYTGGFDVNNNIVYDTIPRFTSSGYRKAHHISEIDVLEQNGMRYIYGIPVYNKIQKDFTFSVGSIPPSSADNLVSFTSNETDANNSPYMTNSSRIEGYVQSQETPGYASSFLLTGLLSPDFVDVTGDGITEDDLGTAVKFNYTKSNNFHKWRTPRSNTVSAVAHFNDGLRTETKDNKATFSYGEREAWYLNSIESKSMIAIFRTDTRQDAKGVLGEMNSKIDTSENVNKRLSRIDLYTKAEIKAKGINLARPIKSVIFEYDYSLCKGSPDAKNDGGKLTLKSVYFSYNGQARLSKERYVFNYGDPNSVNDNPIYAVNASDRWGTYKSPSDNMGNSVPLNNIDYPYTSRNKQDDDKYAGAWSLKKILLPSGGQMEINYEADDYAYVQNRRACNMYKIEGLGSTKNFGSGNSMYNGGVPSNDNYYVYVKLTSPIQATTAAQIKREIFSRYLEGLNQIAFKLHVIMPKSPNLEPLTVYSYYDDYGLCPNNSDYIYIKLSPQDGKSPLATSAIGFLVESLPGQAFPGYDVEVNGIKDFIDLAVDMLGSLSEAFKNVDDQMRGDGNARNINLSKSFIRLDNDKKMKYGGGYRVKRIVMKDNWNRMTGQYNSIYGQDYEYSTTENIAGHDVTVSSGVASYEPGIGSEENPFREIVQFSNKMPMASAQYGAIEMPILEGLYPSPVVGYSEVTVRSIHRKGTHGDSTLRSAIGKQVTKYFTAKDYPAFSANTLMDAPTYNKNPFFSFFYKEVINRKVCTQGFLVETNDMHGKIKSQESFSESDEKTPVSANYHTYKNTGKNGLNDKVDFVHNESGGAVQEGNMGIDVELMTDVREFSIESDGINGQLQVDILVPAPIPIVIPTFFPLETYIENKYRAATCTKVISYHAIEDSVTVMDKGSVITSTITAYDAETGTPIVTKTKNQFDDPAYNVSYPAFWAYSGTGPAYRNIDLEIDHATFLDGRISSSFTGMPVFESGDELFISKAPAAPSGCIPSPLDIVKIWAFDKNKNTTALTVPVKDIIFLDKDGYPYNGQNVNVRIVRSGLRNNLGLTVGNVTAMANPIKDIGGTRKLQIDNTSKVFSANAASYKEKWQSDYEYFKKRVYFTDTCLLTETDSLSCAGIWEKKANPYLKGLIGNFRPYRSFTYYGNRTETNPSNPTNIRANGYIDNFSNFWNFNGNNNLVPDYANAKWVWNSELTKVNAKGQELETRDALNRYTAAQYGYAKNMPVAMTQNAQYGESFYEGFEDAHYSERIHSEASGQKCLNNYIDFNGLSNGSIVNIDSLGIGAHTGKYALMVDHNSTLKKSFGSFNRNDSFNLKFPGGVVYNAVLGTGYIDTVWYSPYPLPTYPTSPSTLQFTNQAVSFSNLGMAAQQTWRDHFNTYYGVASYDLRTTQYTLVQNSGSYTFHFNLYGDVFGGNLDECCHADYMWAYLEVTLTNLRTGYQVAFANHYDDAMPFNQNYTSTWNLPCGLYKITAWGASRVTNPHGESEGAGFGYSCSNLTSYRAQPCYYTKPIPGTDSMLNPVNFALPPEKTMHFSAWVKETCSVPCDKTTYTNTSIQIVNGTSSLGEIKPTGTIIDGWQKFEGDFSNSSGTADLKFINSNGSPIYIDDIRIHPFNANMKSYCYDSRTLRLQAELDENNYASFYDYDEEGQLIRVKKETAQGIKTIKETRNAKQRGITDF